MKNYVQIVNAQQFTGDVQALKDFAGEVNVIVNEEKVLLTENTITKLGKWNVVPGDFVVKTRTGFEVYKEEAFNETFDEVVIVDTPATITESPVVEAKTDDAPVLEAKEEVVKAQEDLATEAPEPAVKNTKKGVDAKK